MHQGLLRRFILVLKSFLTFSPQRKRCYDKYLGVRGEKMNSNSHPEITEGKQVFKIIAKHNDLDMQLYSYILKLFDEQKQVIDSYQ